MRTLFPSTDIGPFGRRQRDVRGHRIPVTLVARDALPETKPGTAVVADDFGTDELDLGIGCTCCTVRDKLQGRLRALVNMRPSQLVIATDAEPLPILRTFATERALGTEFYVENEPTPAGTDTFVLVHDTPLSWNAFSRFIASLTALRGVDLISTHGLLNIDGCQGPVAVQYRQHLALQPVELRAWPDAERHTRIRFVTRGVTEASVHDLLNAVQAVA